MKRKQSRMILPLCLCLLLSVGSLTGCNKEEEIEEDNTTQDDGGGSGGGDGGSSNQPSTHTHTYGEWIIITEATCGSEGLRERYCTSGDDVEQEIIPAVGDHEYIEKVTKEATCTEKGELTKTCQVCGNVTTEEIPKTAHTAPEGTPLAKEPTCTETGLGSYTCTVCGHVLEEEEIPALGHLWSEWSANSDGETHTRTCSRCSKTETGEHEPSHYLYGSDDTSHWHECLECGAHLNETVHISDGSATPLEAGAEDEDTYHLTKCTECEKSYKVAHTFESYYEDSEGNLHAICSECLHVDVGNDTLDPDIGVYTFYTNSITGIEGAITALKGVSGRTQYSTIYIYHDSSDDESLLEEGSSLSISADYVELKSIGEEKVTIKDSYGITLQGDNIILDGFILDGSGLEASGSSAESGDDITVRGVNATIKNCEIYGGTNPSNADHGYGIFWAPNKSNLSDFETTYLKIEGCEIHDCARPLYIDSAKSATIEISDSTLSGEYRAINEQDSTGDCKIVVTNSTFLGYISTGKISEMEFTGCTFGYSVASSTVTTGDKSRGGISGGAGGTINCTDCAFMSYLASGATESNDKQSNLAYNSSSNWNYLLNAEANTSCVYTLVNCQFDNASDLSSDELKAAYSPMFIEVTSDNVFYMMGTGFGSDTTSSGFKFSSEAGATLYTYSDYSSHFATNS